MKEPTQYLNDNLIVSCAIFSNYEILKYKYSQDFSVISQYVDVVMPMIYKETIIKMQIGLKLLQNGL